MNPVDPIASGTVVPTSSVPASGRSDGFKQLVQKSQVTFSRHAASRLSQRNIQLSEHDLSLLHEAMDQARQSGSKEAAVVMGSGIYIVAPNTNTVITTVAKNEQGSMQVISHVDALVLVNGTSTEGVSSPRSTDGGQPASIHWSLMNTNDV